MNFIFLHSYNVFAELNDQDYVTSKVFYGQDLISSISKKIFLVYNFILKRAMNKDYKF